MEYLYFDIECCDGNTMCSLGYVIVDNMFNIKEKEDILINPEKKFKLARAGFDARIKLSYPEEEFLKHPNFEGRYNTIKEILTQKDRIILGHSVGDDLKYIFIACKHYHKSQIKIKAYDTQYIYNKNKRTSLIKIMEDLKIDISNLKEHKSCDDAEMTMLCIKEICKKENCTIDELLKKNQDSIKIYKPPKKKKGKNKGINKFPQNNIIKMQIENELKKKGITYEEYLKGLCV